MTSDRSFSRLCESFVDTISSRPDDIAVFDGDAEISGRELGRHVSAIMDALQANSGSAVGIYGHPSAPLVASAWAALCAGIPYVPLAPSYPEARIRFMIADAGIDLVLTTEALADEVRAMAVDLGARVVCMPTMDHGDLPSGDRYRRPAVVARPDSLAYILYTSGSTGTPKGVEVSHSALAHQMFWAADALEVDTGARVVHKTPISFDAAQWELLANATGAAVVAAERDAYRDPPSLIATIRHRAVTHLQTVPTLLQALCEDEGFAECTSLRRIMSGGEALAHRLAVTATAILPSADLVNLYGPTETTINASIHRFDRGEPKRAGGVVPIGSPVDGMGFHLLDDSGELLEKSDGQRGELAISGPQLARGYRNRFEENATRFVTRIVNDTSIQMYRSGDRVEIRDGLYQFCGRMDSQVKIRGHRIELDEIRSVLENHPWVRHAGVVVSGGDDGVVSSDRARLAAHVELNPHEAALMDQGVFGEHHTTKSTRIQVRAQVAGLGVRGDHDAPGVDLPIGPEADLRLHQLAFARKSYRVYRTRMADHQAVWELGRLVAEPEEWSRELDNPWSVEALAVFLRSLVQYHSEARLLPKYSFASPGALYGVAVYVAVRGVSGLTDGVYYLNPSTATVHAVGGEVSDLDGPGARITLVGQRSVIASVYSTNVDEVLRFEAGHILGVVDTVAPAAGLRVGSPTAATDIDATVLGADGDRFVIGCWPLLQTSAVDPDRLERVTPYAEIFDESGSSKGFHELRPGSAGGPIAHRKLVGAAVIRRKDVIAINQRVHDQASFALVLVSDGRPSSYVALGRALQRAQMNAFGVGLMSSGYSSSSGADLPAARRVRSMTGLPAESVYVALGGPVTAEQIAHTGMDEDVVHTQGPAEILATDIATMLPRHMVPDVIRIVDAVPRTPNGKVDVRALRRDEEAWSAAAHQEIPFVAPESASERILGQIWCHVLGSAEPISTTASFFAVGGTSLHAVRLIREIRSRLGVALPVQSIFEHDSIARQAQALRLRCVETIARAAPLAGVGSRPVFLWPGLGGYPMNLRGLAQGISGVNRRCYGVQAYGLNQGETIDPDISAMARRDVEHLREIQPSGPYTIIGYSFGARVAFETAWQLEAAGETVDQLILIAPGSPRLERETAPPAATAPYDDTRFTRVLCSVFLATADGPTVDAVVASAVDRRSFLDAIAAHIEVDAELADRVVRLVERTHAFEYTFAELSTRRVRAATTVIRAHGDDYSFLDSEAADLAAHTISLGRDHYQILRPPHVDETCAAVLAVLDGTPARSAVEGRDDAAELVRTRS
ncbi:amino acid adenylation domain-containing protein [Williamsia herbipolensis]|uniref:Amino acid adenylation domain-containing protein n=1 Tax=Williamsia herbipolensis TaxID=1603258 RepID=A0AAU4K459_9NOCA|nr:amino acid adenylation domain-containing protein [Williamsia herbipolensis]